MSDLFFLFSTVLKSGSALELNSEIDAIYVFMSSIYEDVCCMHYESAKEAICAGFNSKDYLVELRIAKDNLVSAYSLAKRIRTIKRKKRFLFLFTSESNVLRKEDEREYFLYLSKIAAYICMIYKKIGEGENAARWEREAFWQFDNFLDKILSDDDLEKLSKIDPNYVIEYERQMGGNSLDMGYQEITYIECKMSRSGKAYMREKMRQFMDDFKESLSRGIVFDNGELS